tara:strand:- start:210 stop:443 length:234 start_codon:yes stop_codon:yes gene_type:complete
MNKKHFLFGILAIVFLFVFFSILRARMIPAHTHHHHHHHRPRPRPRPRPMFIGGCRGTRYGCCPGSRKACNEDCSNC